MLSGLSCGQSRTPARTVFIRDVVRNYGKTEKLKKPKENNLLHQFEFEKDISSSIRAIKSLKEETAYKTILEGFPIDKSIATSVKNENDGFVIKFFIDGILDGDYMRDFDKFGIKKNIILDRNGRKHSINENSTEKVTVTLSSPKVITIEVKNFQDQEDDFFNDKTLRLILPTSVEPDFGDFECKSLHISGTTTFCGLIEVKLNEKSYHIFKNKNDDTKEKFLIIDSLEKNSFEEFKKNTSAILLAFGFISGNLFQNEYYYQIIKEDYSTIAEATAYVRKEDSIITNAGLLNPLEFEQYLEYYKKEELLKQIPLRLQSNSFSKICELLSNNSTLARSVKLILVGNQTNLLLLRAGIYSIALETLTGFIYEENKSKLKPISDKKLSQKIIGKFKETLDEYECFLSDYGNEVLKSKIENINSPTNSKKLSTPFEIYNLRLTKSELLILNHRNKFLHGTSPFNEDELKDKDNEIAYISKKLLTLCNSLVLKYCGYSGYMVDYGGYHQFKWEEKVTEHLFKII